MSFEELRKRRAAFCGIGRSPGLRLIVNEAVPWVPGITRDDAVLVARVAHGELRQVTQPAVREDLGH